MKVIFLFSILLFGCDEKPATPRPLTELQQKYLADIPLAQKVYMEDCLKPNGRHQYEFLYCQSGMLGALGVTQKPCEAGTSVTKTAVGTAIGYGAAKLILGK